MVFLSCFCAATLITRLRFVLFRHAGVALPRQKREVTTNDQLSSTCLISQFPRRFPQQSPMLYASCFDHLAEVSCHAQSRSSV